MGLEHTIPISQMEMIRREVQILILLRSLIHQMQLLIPEENGSSGSVCNRTNGSELMIY